MSLDLLDVSAARFWIESGLMAGAFLGRWLLGGSPSRRWLGPATFAATSALWIAYGLLVAAPAFVVGALVMLGPEIRAAVRLHRERTLAIEGRVTASTVANPPPEPPPRCRTIAPPQSR